MVMCNELTWTVTACVASVGILGYLVLHLGKRHEWFVFETILTLDHLKKDPNEKSPDTPIASPVNYGSLNLQDQDYKNTTDQENRNKYE